MADQKQVRKNQEVRRFSRTAGFETPDEYIILEGNTEAAYKAKVNGEIMEIVPIGRRTIGAIPTISSVGREKTKYTRSGGSE